MKTESTATVTKTSGDDMTYSILIQILTAITESDNLSVDDLDPLYDVIDPEALDALFAPRASGSPRPVGEVSFQYADHWVTVTSDGAVELDLEER